MNSISQNIKGLVSKLALLESMYDYIRLVNPVNKKVINVVDSKTYELKEAASFPCFSFWTHDDVCSNCISIRAYREKETFIKIEYTEEKIFMVTAIPLDFEGQSVVIELLRDVTRSLVFDNGEPARNVEIKKLLDEANVAIVTDELTRVYNKRYILEKLPVEMVMARVNEKPLSVVMADIDFFKKVNDVYGHLAGDYILKEFAGILKNNIRNEKDWVARFGGEEFLVCLPDADKKAAFTVAERMRKAVEEAVFTYKDLELKITSSFGVYTMEPVDNIKDYAELIEHVDENLYKAKKNGRNCVVGC